MSGCFYTETVNQRPSLDIEQEEPEPGIPVYREGDVTLRAVSHDPENHFVWFQWRVYACSDQTDCDQAPFDEQSSNSPFKIHVPKSRVDSPEAVQAIHVWLEGQDEYGANARPAQQLWITVDDHPPTIELGQFSAYDFVVTAPVQVIAKVDDPDDGPSVPQVSWKVYTPSNQPAYTIVDDPSVVLDKPPLDDFYEYGKLLWPSGTGKYTVEVTATDGIAPPTVQTIEVNIVPDRAPCLRTMTPLVAVAPAALPMSEPTLFQVLVVSDDLDPYPTANDAHGLLDTPRFTWSVLAPGGPRQVLSGVTGNSVALNPASYQPGDIVELRVEIADRNLTPITCGDGNATCSVIADNGCLQRQTWRVEVR
ncbi:MAG TPA: hypothetical protein VIV11_15180 [Kofleriaceae bacterium]